MQKKRRRGRPAKYVLDRKGKPIVGVNGGVKVSHLAEQKYTTHSLYSRDRPGCQYSILASSFLLSG